MAELDNLAALGPFLSDLEQRLAGDMTDGLDLARGDVAVNMQGIFDAKVSSTGEAWAPHAPATVRQYGPHPLLILTSAMYQSLTTDFGANGSVINNTGRSLEWGTEVQSPDGFLYALAQNYGTMHIPAREFMYWTETGADAVTETIADWIDSTILQEIVQ